MSHDADILYPSNSCGVPFNAVMGVEFEYKTDDETVTTVDEAKLWCKIDGNDDDILIRDLMAVARIMCEKYCNISFTERTVTATLNNSCGKIFLPYGPMQAGEDELTSAIDADGNDVTVVLKGNKFKYIFSPLIDHLEIVYEAGYGLEDATDNPLPLNLKSAVLNQIAYLYENRGDSHAQSQLSPDAKVILNQVKR